MQSLDEQRTKLPFFDLLPAEFDAAAKGWGWPAFRAKQVREWVYGRYVGDPAQMTNLSKADRAILSERISFGTAELSRNLTSEDGTHKLLLTWGGGQRDEKERASRVGAALTVLGGGDSAGLSNAMAQAECVMIPDGDRRTACVSSQVGCPVGCTFCASGIGGVKGSLTAGQIVEQIWWLNVLGERQKDEGKRQKEIAGAEKLARISNVVFMGMGEPLANYAAVMKAIRIMHDPECFNIGARKITVSTVGVPPKMRELAGEELPINLAISLHAPNEPLRKKLIPWANHFALADILNAARFYFDQTGREITLEYILLAGVNDRPDHARELAKVCKTLRANVNLIRYNEVESLPFKRPASGDVVEFQEILRRAGVNAHVRKSRGRDIDAACGQLRRKEAEKAKA